MVTIEQWTAGESIRIANARGIELLVLSGSLTLNGHALDPLSWARLPSGTDIEATLGDQGAKLWIKQAPLLHHDLLPLP